MAQWRRSLARLRWISMALGIVGAVCVAASGRSARAQSDRQPHFLTTSAGVSALLDAASRRLDYVPNQVVVKFRTGVNRAGQQRALMALRSRPAVDDLTWAGPVALVTDLGQPDATILAAQLGEQPEVEYAEPNYLYRSTSTPNDPSFSSRQWNLQALDLPRAWDINPGATEAIIVAVVDSGVTTTNSSVTFRTWNGSGFVNASIPFRVNPDLSQSRLVSPWDFVGGSSTVLDMDGHGTHVSSTVAEDTNNSLAEAGVAYKARVMPLKVCSGYWDVQFRMSALGIPGFTPLNAGGCANSDVSLGIRFAADNGARVINVSLGGAGVATTIEEAIKYAVSKGAFVAIAAGNEFLDGNATQYPAAYAETIDGAMAVGAVGRSLRHASYSSTGPYVEIAAPGGDFDAGDAGKIWQVTTLEDDRDPRLIFPRFDRYIETPMQGTSMASPHVAGIAALIMSHFGSAATPARVEQIIKKTARPCDLTDCDPTTAAVGTVGRNNVFGYGLIQPRAALLGLGLAR
jgi:serine protease